MRKIASVATTEYILNKYDLCALKKYGQNFIIDSNVIEKIINSAGIDKNTIVVEIGPGIGALTQLLAQAAKKVYCYEIDERFKPVYQEFFTSDNIIVTFGDFMKISLSQELTRIKEDDCRIVLVANLPYYITADIIEKVMIEGNGICELVVMVQKEVALKYVNSYPNPLIMMLHYLGKLDYLFTVSKTVFNPKPRVDSAIMSIKLNKSYDAKLYELLTVCFKQRRKTIYNNLKQSYCNATEILDKCGIDGSKRSEQLTITDFVKIKDCLSVE